MAKEKPTPMWVDPEFKKILQHSMIDRGYRSMHKYTKDLVSTPIPNDKVFIKDVVKDGKNNKKSYFLKF